MKLRLCSGIALAILGIAFAGCVVEQSPSGIDGTSGSGSSFSQEEKAVRIDGSSTVAPISSAVAEVFGDANPDVVPRVNISGTGGGFDKFSRGETDISNASRPIKPSEAEACRKNDVEYVELRIATDGLTVVVHPENDWCSTLSIEQLRQIWAKDSTIEKWSDIDPSWPADPIKLLGPDSKSGTYDYFKEETVGEAPMRSDYQPNSDDQVLVTGVAGEKLALAFFGYAYYSENQDKLKAVAIAPEDSAAAVAPSRETIESGEYSPLSRPLFIYVNKKSLQRPELAEFVKFHLSPEGQDLVTLKKYVKLNPRQLAEAQSRLEAALQDAKAN